ncbi:SKA complex subunit 3 [Paramisgurnus dabryanus]|uniref:SKA complex subunit 3 n=1 Tax=Paramisgurnus dabryanus TaxID=90735 RepID=UPI0031F36AE3
MNPSERFFAKLRKLTVYLETESNSLLHTSQNLKEDDDDAETGVQALYQLHSEVRQLKRQVQDQMGTHDATSTDLRTFIRRCLVLKQRTTEDIDRLKKHYEKYGYRPRKARQDNTVTSGTKEVEEQEERELEAEQEDEEMGQEVCEDAPPFVDQQLTPKLSDFGLSSLHFQKVFSEAEAPHHATVVPAVAVALSPPPFVMNMQPPQPKTPKCLLRMEEDAPTPRLEDFGISEYTMCWNNDFTMDLFKKKPSDKSSETMDNDKKPPHLFSNQSSMPNKDVFNDSLESPEPPVFCTPGFKIEKYRLPSSPQMNKRDNLDSPPHQNCPTPEVPAFETPYISKLLKKEARQEEGERHRSSQERTIYLPELSNARCLSNEAPEMPRIQSYEDAIPEMPSLQSLFGNSLAAKSTFGDSLSGLKMDLKQGSATMPEDCVNQDWCLSTPKVRARYPAEPCTPEMPDISSVTQDILKVVAQCKS